MYQQTSCEFFQFANLKNYYGFDTNKILVAYQKVSCELFQYATLKHCCGFDQNNTNGFAIDWINIINKILMQCSDTLFITLNRISELGFASLIKRDCAPTTITCAPCDKNYYSIVILKNQQLNNNCSCDTKQILYMFLLWSTRQGLNQVRWV